MVENLEDMWKVTKLQQERKGLLERQAALKEMVQLKAETSEVGHLTSPHMVDDLLASSLLCIWM